MASQPQPLCSPLPCTPANGNSSMGQSSGSPETGDARPKPSVKPKPRMLPKPAVPAKPCIPLTSPGPRQPLSEVPSAEKINLLAGPKPYGGGVSSAVRRPSFGRKCPIVEASNGKGRPPPLPSAGVPFGAAVLPSATKEPSASEGIPVEEHGGYSSVPKSTAPFKVKPVLVAAKPERFPGTTVEEILAKMELPCKEGSGSPDRPWGLRSSFSHDVSSVHLGPKGYAAFRRWPSVGEGGEKEGGSSIFKTSQEVERRKPSGEEAEKDKRNREETQSQNGQHVPEPQQSDGAAERNSNFASRDSSYIPPSTSCNGDQSGQRRSPSPPGISVSQTSPAPATLRSGVAPGSPYVPTEPTEPPCAPCLPAEAPGSPSRVTLVASVPVQLPSDSPDAPAEPPSPSDEVGLFQAPGSPAVLAKPCPLVSGSPGSPEAPKESSYELSKCVGLPSPLTEPSPGLLQISLLSKPSASMAQVLRESDEPAGPCPDPPSHPSAVFGSPGSPDALPEPPTQSPGSPYPQKDSLSPSEDGGTFRGLVQTSLPEDKDPQAPQLGLRRASEGVVHLPTTELNREELGGSLATLPRGGNLPSEQTLVGESNWSLSQSFEWSFPSRAPEWGGKRLGSPPRSPIKEAESDSGGEEPSLEESQVRKGSEGLSKREHGPEVSSEAPVNSPCLSDCQDPYGKWSEVHGQPETPSVSAMSAPGGPVAQREPVSPERKGPGVAEEGGFQEEQDDPLPCVPVHEEGALRVVEPLPGVEQAAPLAQPCILFSDDAQLQTAASCHEDDSALGLAQESEAGKDTGPTDPLKSTEPHSDSHWLDELLASPPPSADDTKRKCTSELGGPLGPEDLLGWSRKDLCSEFGIGGASRPGDFGMGWVGESGAGKRDWANETEQDREFGTGKRDWPSKYSIGDVNQQDVGFSTSQRDWARGTELMGDSSVESTDWLSTYGSGDADQRDREFNASNPDWSSTYSIGSADNQDRELSARQPDWPSTYGIEDTDKKTSDYGASKPDWTSEYNQRAADRQDREFGASKPAWPTEYHPRDAELSARQAEWPNEYCLREAPQQSREFSAGKPDWSSDYGIDQTGQEREFRVRSRDQTSEFGVGDSELCAQKPVWRDECSLSDTDQQDFAAASRDWAKDFCTGGAERENQFGAIGKDWAGSFGFSTSDPVDSAEATNNQTDWAGDFRTGAPDEPRGVGEGQSDQARDVRDMDISSDLTVGSSAMPRESGEGQSDWACNLGLGSQAVASGLGDVGSEEPREAGVGQIDCTCKYSVGSTDTSDTRAASSVESKEASVAQMDWASGPGIEHSDQSYRFGGGILDGDEDQHPGTKGNSEDSLVGRPCSPQCSSNSHMLANSVTREAAVERPASFQSSHSEVERGPGNSADDPPPVAEKAWPYPFPLDEEDRLQPDGGAEASQSHSGDGNGVSMGTRKPSQPDQGGQEDHTMEGPGALVGPDFAFLEDAEVLDSAVYRDRANLGRKRGHRPPAIRPVGAMGLSETDRDSWMFEDSTEPQAVRAASSDEEAVEEPRSRRARTSPVLKGVKVPLFPSLSPSALKAKLRGRNRSAEEGALQGEVKQSSSKEVHVQRSKSCKIPSLSGKPLVLPPKPEKSSGSETTSPHWLQALKLKKKKS